MEVELAGWDSVLRGANGLFDCPECSEGFADSQDIRNHMVKDHDGNATARARSRSQSRAGSALGRSTSPVDSVRSASRGPAPSTIDGGSAPGSVASSPEPPSRVLSKRPRRSTTSEPKASKRARHIEEDNSDDDSVVLTYDGQELGRGSPPVPSTYDDDDEDEEGDGDGDGEMESGDVDDDDEDEDVVVPSRSRPASRASRRYVIVEDDEEEEEVDLYADDAGSVYQDVPEGLIDDSKAPHHSPDLIRPPELARARLAFHPTLHIAICEDCGFAVPRSEIEGHYRGALHRGKHGRLLPQPAVLKKLLDEHQIFRAPAPPLQPIVPIQSIPQHHGVQCTFEGCNYATNTKASAETNHTAYMHKGKGGSSLLEDCTVQLVFKHPYEYWVVEPSYSTFAGDRSEEMLKNFLRHLYKEDKKGTTSDTAENPTNERLITPFLRTFKWHSIIEGHSASAIRSLSGAITEDDEFEELSGVLKKYFRSIDDLVYRTSVLARQWLNTPKGYVLLLQLC